MNAQLERARLLFARHRHAEAEQELRRVLLESPDNPDCLALLAFCLSALHRHDEARDTIRRAIGLVPDSAYLHYVHACVLCAADQTQKALSAINEAVRLNPSDADYFARLSVIHLELKDNEAALSAAEKALALDPENTPAANFRSMALIRLGRKQEAQSTMAQALEREPENAFSHANQGWNELHRNNPKKAQEHFLEALRLQPGMEYARNGMLEALKARNPVYRVLLAYFLWMGRQSSKMQWAFIIGTLVAQRVLRVTAEKSPELGVLLWPVLILFYGFIYLSWVAAPLFNLLLRLNRFGRLVLSPEERCASNWFALPVIGVVGGLIAFAFGWFPGAILAAVCAVLSVCVSSVFSVGGTSRVILALASGAMSVLGLVGWALITWGDEALVKLGGGMLSLGVLAFLGFQFLAIALARRE